MLKTEPQRIPAVTDAAHRHAHTSPETVLNAATQTEDKDALQQL